jgi:putative pyruvate formate lyase activating enzyme
MPRANGSAKGSPAGRAPGHAVASLSAESTKALASCRLCPRACGANRLAGETGFCRAGLCARVAAVSIHHGEEPPISGSRGSGTVFFAHCNMTCLFCQNYPISQLGHGRSMDTETLAGELLKLQGKRAHNVNFVTPTPHVPQLVDAVRAAREKGFALPVVYNTNGYDSLEALALLDGVVDVYLPDAKYRSRELSEAVSGAPDYPGFNDAALAEMVRQVGFLATDADGIATRGVLVRHLVLPGRVEETVRVLERLKEVFGPDLPLSLMGQYFPAYRASETPGFERRLSEEEYEEAVDAAVELGLNNVFIQEI